MDTSEFLKKQTDEFAQRIAVIRAEIAPKVEEAERLEAALKALKGEARRPGRPKRKLP